MTGITFLTNQEGATTHVVLDWQKYGESIKELLEDLHDKALLEQADLNNKEGLVTIQQLRKELIEMGTPENDLMEIPDV